ncbi:MAG: hypothetical protein K2P78_00015 [Gemmataceae bacterium]|nr:hypothetical protein [Gemmataceae bacterium]
MSEKQAVLAAVGGLSESAGWVEIADALLAVVARRGSAADFARLYRSQLTAADLAEYLNPPAGTALDAVIAELEARPPARESA